MPWFYFLLGALVVLLLYGDVRARASTYMTPEKKALVKYDKWPIWKEIEPVDSRKRVLCIDHDYVPFVNAGSEICTHAINKHLMKKPYKWDVWVAAPGYPNRTYEGIRCFDLYDTDTFLKVYNSCHVINSHSYFWRDAFTYMCRTTGIPFISWIHTLSYVNAVKRHKKDWHDPRCGPAQWTVFNSKSLRQEWKGSITNDKIFIPVVDYREYNIEEKQRAPKYVILSNVNANKGGDLFIQLAKAMPDVEFLGVTGGYGRQVKAEGIPNLRYIPHTNRIHDIYKQAWLVLMPSKDETWGRTAVEAMSSGIPMVVHPTPGLRECCGGAAIYVDRGDLEGWINAVRRMKDDQKWYNERSKVALDRARALDPRPVLANIEDWLEHQVVPSRQAGRPLTAAEKNLLFR